MKQKAGEKECDKANKTQWHLGHLKHVHYSLHIDVENLSYMLRQNLTCVK